MKKILTLLAIGIVGLTSCRNEVTYFLQLSATYDIDTDAWRGDPIKPFGDSEKTIYIKAEMSSGSYELPPFTWSVTCDKDWCHFEYRELGGSSIIALKFICDDNTTGEDRTAVLTVRAGEASFDESVVQLGTPCVIVSTPGTLTQELANKDLLYATSLKISGALNDKDIETIKGLRAVETLDLTEVIIDDLPDEMFYRNETIKNIKLPNSITTIHPKTFAFSSLEYIYFPAGIETIEDGERYTNEYSWEYYGAFANTNLATIEFAPNSKLKYIGELAFAGAGNNEGYEDSYGSLTVTFPASVETIADAAFCDNAIGNSEYRRPSVYLSFGKGSNLKSFGSSSLNSLSLDASNCTMIEYVGLLSARSVTMKIGTSTPPRSSGVSVNSYLGGQSSLYVPKGCVGAYYDADGWKEFDTIKEIGQE